MPHNKRLICTAKIYGENAYRENVNCVFDGKRKFFFLTFTENDLHNIFAVHERRQLRVNINSDCTIEYNLYLVGSPKAVNVQREGRVQCVCIFRPWVERFKNVTLFPMIFFLSMSEHFFEQLDRRAVRQTFPRKTEII